MTAVQQQAATDPAGPTGRIGHLGRRPHARRRPAGRRRAGQIPAARRPGLRPGRGPAAVVADRHRRGPWPGRPGRHRCHRHRADHRRTRGGGAQRHVHPGLRTRRLPSAGAAAQLLTAHPGAAVDGVGTAAARPPAPSSCSGRSSASKSARGSATRCTAPRCWTAAGIRGRCSAPTRRRWRRASCAGCRPAQLEDALGLAGTQSAGLMAAQYEAMSKRMHHGLAARNGFYAAGLAAAGYTGIKRVFEREYGGFLSVFGEGHDPDASLLTGQLGQRWETTIIMVKSYAAMGGLHGAIDAARQLRQIRCTRRYLEGRHHRRRDRLQARLVDAGAPAHPDRRADEHRIRDRRRTARRQRAARTIHRRPGWTPTTSGR